MDRKDILYSTYIELSESALKSNIRFLKKQIGTGVKFSSVIKGNAYGHGINVFVPLAERCGVDHFSVFSADEAYRVMENRTQESEVMIMGAIENEAIEWAIINGISFYVFELERLACALYHARRLGIPARIHIELETGMNRTGFIGHPLETAVELICNHRDWVEIEGVCTHFAGAESVQNYLRVQNQINNFNKLCVQLKSCGLQFKRRHTASSAAALTYPDTRMDMVRFGIAQYGFWPTQETRMNFILQHQHQARENNSPARAADPLKRVISWKSRVMSVKKVDAGQFIGYGTSYLTTYPQQIASVPVGYYHGFSRNLSNLGRVLIHGRRVPVVGVVNMNMVLIDITNIPNVQKGDEVVIIGKQKKLNISVSSFSDLTRYLNYEVLVRLPSDIPRFVVK